MRKRKIGADRKYSIPCYFEFFKCPFRIFLHTEIVSKLEIWYNRSRLGSLLPENCSAIFGKCFTVLA